MRWLDEDKKAWDDRVKRREETARRRDEALYEFLAAQGLAARDGEDVQ